jgi:hypothetical protein
MRVTTVGAWHSGSGSCDLTCQSCANISFCRVLCLILCQIRRHIRLRSVFWWFLAVEMKLSVYSSGWAVSRASDEQGGIWAKEKEPVRIVLLSYLPCATFCITVCEPALVQGLSTEKLISVRNHLIFCEGITVGLGLPEDGVKRHGNAYEWILIRVVLRSWLINGGRIVIWSCLFCAF